MISWPTPRQSKSPDSITAEVLSATAPLKGQPVRICQIGARWVSVPVSASPYYMPEADGVVQKAGRANGSADLVVFAKDEAAQKRLVLAGCDPATSFLSHMVEKISGVEIVSAAASGESPNPFSRSADTGSSVAPTNNDACSSVSSRSIA